MKRFFSRSLPGGLALAVLILSLLYSSSCRKVDTNDDMIRQYPFLVLTNYPKQVVVGDTCTFTGKLFLDRPGSAIQIGQAKAVVISRSKVWAANNNTRTGLPDSFDVARFVIMPDMGSGPNIPVTVTANGYTVQGPALTIRKLVAGIGQTDTSLVVTRLAAWLPANASSFPGAFVNNSSVSPDGTIYFDNPRGVFQVKNQAVTPIIRSGDNLKDQNNASFAIDVMIGSVISPDGGTLTFSAVVKENIPRADTLFITRLCQMNMATQAVTTLNRSSFRNFPTSPTYNEDPSPYNGPVGQIKLSAARLQTDINGNIWFMNIYYPAKTGYSTVGPYIASNDFYPAVANGSIPLNGCLFNVCQLTTDGKVQSIGTYVQAYDPTSSPYVTPGVLYDDDLNPPAYTISKDGSILLGFKFNPSYNPAGIYQMDVAGQEIVNTILPKARPWLTNYTAFSFKSYDTSARTRLSNSNTFTIMTTEGGLFNRFLLLPDNELLYSSDHSIFSYDLQHLTAYCYAGTENENSSQQIQETGKAKWVDFGPNYPANNNGLIFCGTDRQGAVYYCQGGSTEFIDGYCVNDITNGVRFYKLYHP